MPVMAFNGVRISWLMFGAELGAGECGEIVIGGAGLAQGYVNPKSGGDGIDNVLTGRAFRGAGETRVYHTGDQGYRNDEGLLFFEGRLDGQIKLRGVRLELGEIESAILSQPAGAAAAAVVLGAGSTQRSTRVSYENRGESHWTTKRWRRGWPLASRQAFAPC